MNGNLVVSILDKIATLTEANVQVSTQVLTATKKTNEILSKEIHTELKKQTSVLTQLGVGIQAIVNSNNVENALKSQQTTLSQLVSNIQSVLSSDSDKSGLESHKATLTKMIETNAIGFASIENSLKAQQTTLSQLVSTIQSVLSSDKSGLESHKATLTKMIETNAIGFTSIENSLKAQQTTLSQLVSSIQSVSSSDSDKSGLESHKATLTKMIETNAIGFTSIENSLKAQSSNLTELSKNIQDLIKSDKGDVNFSLFGGKSKMSKIFIKFFEKTEPKKINAMAKSIELLAGSINKLTESLGKLDESKLKQVTSFFTNISKGIALFALSVVLAAPALLIGTLVTLPLILLWGAAFNLIGKHSKNVKHGADAIKSMGIAVGLLGIAVASYVYFNGGAQGALVNTGVVALSVFIMTLPMIFIAKNLKNLTKSAIGLGIMSLSVFLLGLAVNSYYEALGGDSKNPGLMLLATATVAGSLLLIGGAFSLLGRLSTNIAVASIAMAMASVSVVILSLAVKTWMDANPNWEHLAMLGATVVGVGISMSIVGNASGTILLGAIAMIISSASVMILASAVKTWMDAKPEWEPLAMLGATVVGLGTAMAAAGAVSALIIPGAIGMLIASVAIIPLAKAVDIWMNAKPTSEMVGMIGTTIIGIGAAVAGWGLASVLIIPGAAAMLIASSSIMMFAESLANYKKANWKDVDSDTLLNSMSSILSGFINIFTELSYGDIAKAMNGTLLLGALGNSMSQFAQGIAAMAELQAPTYVVKDGQLVLSGTKQLDPNFAKQISTNIQVMLDSIIKPLAALGENEGMFFDGSVGNGIDLLGRLGNSLSQFAQGIAAMSELQAPTYVVKDGKLVLESTKPLDPAFAENVGKNINMMVSALVNPMKELGEQEGMFTSGPVGKGIELLGDLGNSLSNFAQGVQNMANLQVPIYEVKDGKLVLKSTKPLDTNFAKKVGENIDMIVSALIAPIKKLGSNSGSFFDSDFEAGLDMLSKIGEPVAQLGEGVSVFNQLDAKGFNGQAIADNIVALAKGLHDAFDKKSGYTYQQGSSLRYFAETMEKLSNNMDLKTSAAEDVATSFASITKSVNTIDMRKLTKLNTVMLNFNKLAITLKNSFEDIDGILEKLIKLITNLTEMKESTKTIVNVPKTGSRVIDDKLPSTIEISNIDEIVNGLGDIKNALLGTLDVRLEDDLINR